MKRLLNYLGKKVCKLIFFVSFFSQFSNSQSIVPSISARVDTTKVEIKKVYNLYKNYLNSSPDSIYRNPNWKESENDFYLKSKLLKVDRSANLIFNYYKAKDYFEYYNPNILQIDSIDSGRYQIKTIFLANCPDEEYKKHNPSYITKLYAIKDKSNEFKLENCIVYDTKFWKNKKFKFITYYIHPSCSYNKEEAKIAVKFCKNISEKLGLPIQPFSYYVLPNTDELGKLYNFDYWLYYLGGQTNIPLREIFTTQGNFNYPHEFVHIILPLPQEMGKYCPMIINEGIATWLAGPGFDMSFEEAIRETGTRFNQLTEISIDDIVNFKIRNEFDNTILYTTGGVLCKLIYEKKGKEGIFKIYNSTNDNYKIILEELFEMEFKQIEKIVINYIKDYK